MYVRYRSKDAGIVRGVTSSDREAPPDERGADGNRLGAEVSMVQVDMNSGSPE
jgi:hypothetical protein